MTPRDSSLDSSLDWLNHLGEFCHIPELQKILTATATGYRVKRNYIDEMTDLTDLWQEQLSREIEKRVYEEFMQTKVSIPTINWSESDLTKWAKVNIEPEDVDLEEFEKILNGG